jgi:hypothetical protein
MKLAYFLSLLIFLPAIACRGRKESARPSPQPRSIKVDQVGYSVNAPKLAMVTAPAQTFQVKRAVDNAVMLQGKLSASALDANSGDQVEAADFSSLRYLLGRNTFSLSWVTQVGANPFRHPHHRPSGADKNPEPWPGLLSGGPDAATEDPVLRALPPNLPPAKVYSDNQGSYASNEVCINWQAMLVFLLAGALE